MSRPFCTNEPMLQGAFAPVFVEGDSCDLPVTGEIPKALNGALYRNGPNVSGRIASFSAPWH